MIELRKDYILDRWSYIALGRGKRPQEVIKDDDINEAKVCYFCPNNESMTPPEIDRIGDQQQWQTRWFPNKFPAVNSDLNPNIELNQSFLIKGEGYGFHEVLAETPEHHKQLADLNVDELYLVLVSYVKILQNLTAKQHIQYVQIFKNSGIEAGTSIEHSHSQIIASSIVPKYVQEKIVATKQYSQCPYCDIVKIETASERLIAENESFAAFTSFAPRFNYEALIFPKKHYQNLTLLSESELKDLAVIFHKILQKLGKIQAPYNFFLHYAPTGEDLHFHFEITPRLNTWAGFELATDSFIVTTAPEEAAKFYRE